MSAPVPNPDAPVAYCPRCGADNRCALATGAPIEQCWCSQSPAAMPVPIDTAASCYCPRCLQALAEAGDAR
jgi:hypothetical protein